MFPVSLQLASLTRRVLYPWELFFTPCSHVQGEEMSSKMFAVRCVLWRARWAEELSFDIYAKQGSYIVPKLIGMAFVRQRFLSCPTIRLDVAIRCGTPSEVRHLIFAGSQLLNWFWGKHTRRCNNGCLLNSERIWGRGIDSSYRIAWGRQTRIIFEQKTDTWLQETVDVSGIL